MLYNPLPFLLFPVGAYLLWRLKFFYILHPIRSLRMIWRDLGRKENISSLLLALAGTLGVGNLLGVAIGIIVGGPGSLFWLLLSAIPSSVLKYTEVVACSEGGSDAVGMSAHVRRSFLHLGKPLSVIYSLACLFLSLVMGACLQTGMLVDSASLAFGIERSAIAITAVVVVLISIYRGPRFVSKITAIAIPLTTTIYIMMTILTVSVNISNIGNVINCIITSAFSPLAAGGGVLALFTSQALREGFARGMLSNEAGAGTSTLAHATGGDLHPAKRGLFGVIEVYFDTAFLCMLSGLAILSSVPDPSSFENGTELLMSAITGALGEWAAAPLVLSVCAFAYSTVICWYYYGASSLSELIGGSSGGAFIVVYLLFALYGGFASSGLLVHASDALLLILALITLPTLIKSSDRVKSLSEQIGLIRRGSGKERRE